MAIYSYPLKMVIFHSYVSLPEGKPNGISWEYRKIIEFHGKYWWEYHESMGGNIIKKHPE